MPRGRKYYKYYMFFCLWRKEKLPKCHQPLSRWVDSRLLSLHWLPRGGNTGLRGVSLVMEGRNFQISSGTNTSFFHRSPQLRQPAWSRKVFIMPRRAINGLQKNTQPEPACRTYIMREPFNSYVSLNVFSRFINVNISVIVLLVYQKLQHLNK